jgi:hypothetical protein
MSVHNGKLYCVGNFEKIGGVQAMGLASWDGTQWCGYNTDFELVPQYCGATNIAFYNDTMYVAGGFDQVDNLNFPFIAKWIGGNYVDTCGVISTGINESLQQNFSVSVFSNPATISTTFQIENALGNKRIIIYDQLGKEIWRKETNESMIEVSTENFSAGLYFYRIENGNAIVQGKFIVSKPIN